MIGFGQLLALILGVIAIALILNALRRSDTDAK